MTKKIFLFIGFAAVVLILSIIAIGKVLLPTTDNEVQSEIHNDTGRQQSQEDTDILFDQDGVSVTFYWPEGRTGISNEESEINVLNQSKNTIAITNPSLTYSANSITFAPASEGWESFASPTSRTKIDRVIIYSSQPEQPLTLAPGQLGKLHYHYLFTDQFVDTISQSAQISLDLEIGSQPHTIKQQLTRAVTPEEHFESSAVHPVEEQIREHGPGPGHN